MPARTSRVAGAPCYRRALVSAIFIALAGTWTSAAGSEEGRSDVRRIRTTSPRIIEALQAGLNQSGTLRDLVDRVEESDLIIHITTLTPGSGGGQMNFAASTPENRYVRIAVKESLPWPQLIAILGHELQHAVEIADAPQVVDAASMRTHYESIGYSVEIGRHETRRARDAGIRVLREVTRPAPDAPAKRSPPPSVAQR